MEMHLEKRELNKKKVLLFKWKKKQFHERPLNEEK
jgi:hypothetical protein